MTIGIWDAPPLQKTPEEEEAERRRQQAVQFGADYDRDPNEMLRKIEQQRRSRDVMGQIDPLTQEIIREKEDFASGAYLDRPYTPGQRAPVPSTEPPPMVGPPSPRPPLGGRRPLRTVQDLGNEGPLARANTPGLAQIEGRAAVSEGGWKEGEDQAVMAQQMAQAAKSNAMRTKVADALTAQRAANPRKQATPRLKTTLGPGPGLGSQYFQDGVPIEPNPMAVMVGKAFGRGGRMGKSPEEIALGYDTNETRRRIAEGSQGQRAADRLQRPKEIAQRIEGRIKIAGVEATADKHLANIKARLSMKEKEFLEAQRNGRADARLKQDYKIHLQNEKTRLAQLRTTKAAQPEGGFAGFGKSKSEEMKRIEELEAEVQKDLDELGE